MNEHDEHDEPAINLILDKSLPDPYYRQVYNQIRHLVLQGHLLPGAKLPSTRAFARDLNCSRTTLIQAYQLLESDGYIETTSRSRTIISENIPVDIIKKSIIEKTSAHALDCSKRFSQRGLRYAEEKHYPPMAPAIQNYIDVRDIPFSTIVKLFRKTWLRPKAAEICADNDVAGYHTLREAVAEHIAIYRGVVCHPDQVVITNGGLQAFSMISQFFLDPGDQVWLENPSALIFRRVFGAAGAHVVPVPVDDQGIIVKQGRRAAPKAKLAFVTPSHQFPLGVTLSLNRRLELLQWANEVDALVIEDDYDSEYRYAGHPPTPLQELDKHSRVFYVGSFSKFLFPALRMGYVIVPAALVEQFLKCRIAYDYHTPVLMQPVLAEFVHNGYLAKHIRKVRKRNLERQNFLIETCRRYLKDQIIVKPSDGGMTIVGYFSEELAKRKTDWEIEQETLQLGLKVYAISRYYFDKPAFQGLLFWYTAMTKEEIEKSVKAIAAVIN